MTQHYDSQVFGYSLNEDGTANSLISGDTNKPMWLHGDFSKADCTDWLNSLDIPARIVESLARPESRPRSLSNSHGILLNLRALNMNPNNEPENMVSLRLWIEKNRLVSLRQSTIYSVQDVRKTLDEGEGPSSISEILVFIIERIADKISEFVDGIETHVDTIEDNLGILDPTVTRSSINKLKRQAVTIRRHLAPQREALENFNFLAKGQIDETSLYLLREQSDRIIRYVEDLDLVRERTQVLQEELTNRVAQEQNARMYVLSIIAAIFLPISFVTGLFGMNVGGMPWVESKAGFFIVGCCMLVVSISIIAYFKNKRWL